MGTRKTITVGLLCALLGTAFISQIQTTRAAEASAVDRPNFILIYTDDQRFDALRANENPAIHTPNLDRLAARGKRFTNANVVMSLCSPSRAAVLTGRYGTANGVTGLDGKLNDDERTFANILADAGYQTGLAGKWHLKDRVPDLGFDFRVYFPGNGTYYGRKTWDNDHYVSPPGHVDAYCADRAVDFLEAAAKEERPFVLFHATQLPHMDGKHEWPSEPEHRGLYKGADMPLPKTWQGDLTGKPEYLATVRNRTQAESYGYDKPENIQKHTADYYGVITELDAILGKLFGAMDRLGLWENTYVIFMSDNGWMLGEHGFTSKVLPYDPSIRVPMIIAGPGIEPGVEDRIALNIDIAPTMLELAGEPIPGEMHGKSLAPLLCGREAPWREAFVYECLGKGYGGTKPVLAATDGRHKLIATWNHQPTAKGPVPAFIELYDLANDPDETKNLADEPGMGDIQLALGHHIAAHLVNVVPEGPSSYISGEGKPPFSGIYPHLASFNSQGECGTGAVVPWAERLWVITYSPHEPNGSDDKLYEIDAERNMTIRPESVGGTPANRMIHEESGQLFIGAYAIDKNASVRVIPPSKMKGRLTGNARHLTAPDDKIYFATMEEGFYEVDVNTLDVTELYPDANGMPGGHGGPLLPGYHGKGLYSGQGRLIYANNGDTSPLAKQRPDVPSGVLAEWDGKDWTVVMRNQFTEVAGPNGIFGAKNPKTDPVWSIGWDHRSLILMLLDEGRWTRFRLPKPSHCYDGAHGWNTEWPRIRDIGEDNLMMTMHGAFWRFPRDFKLGNTSGIAPRSTYLKVVGDFCRWGDKVVLGCDDAAKSEFLNKRKSKGEVAGPAQSSSNVWFLEPEKLDTFGPPLGRGFLWYNDSVTAGQWSDPFLFDGFEHRGLHLTHDADQPVTFAMEVDRNGDGQWTPLGEVRVPANGYRFTEFAPEDRGAWIRLAPTADCTVTASFVYRNSDRRPMAFADHWSGLAHLAKLDAIGGLLRAGDRKTGLQMLTTKLDPSGIETTGYYELTPELHFKRIESQSKTDFMAEKVAPPKGVYAFDDASAIFIDEDGTQYRLPVGNDAYRRNPALIDMQRTDREVVTERDLFQCAGTFFELPARNADGFCKIRPIATHPFFIEDYCSWRGMLVLSGLSRAEQNDPHVIRSDDGMAAVWLGTVDDLWSLGKAVGVGGPWMNTPVKAGEPSDPYLMTGYDKKTLQLSHDANGTVDMDVQVDISGKGDWRSYQVFDVAPGKPLVHEFPDAFQAYWVRVVPSQDCAATAQLTYE